MPPVVLPIVSSVIALAISTPETAELVLTLITPGNTSVGFTLVYGAVAASAEAQTYYPW